MRGKPATIDMNLAGRRAARTALLCGALACLAVPAAAQVMTRMPFGQSGQIVTPLPFGQKNKSPLKPLGVQAATLNVAAQYNMDETSGNVMLDSSGNNNNGTTTDVAMTGAGYVFNGTSSKVIVKDSPTLNPGTRDFSFSAQVQPDKVPLRGQTFEVLRKGTGISSGGEYRIEIYHGSGKAKAHCSLKDSTGVSASLKGGPNLADGQLHTITCTKTATGLTMQVDALPPFVQTIALTGSILTKKPLTVGAKQGTLSGTPSDFFSGLIKNATLSIAAE